ncbi:FGGY-family carbohydrate kinase [Gloeocapsa sp. PCC 73106]|uniref:FGGY-family carbohydrate kinase n=1 Tax=Gloeocapsa sp. PCC 73106 TaxID=102232 RepID=UPI0002ABB929|nr:FGGY-family carbohydrate kinase [Gloeocapsa sp. PCC 73106]ELR98314.1 pentulose/hexulose kinase [Gloeocapsa sp. PCC 73106]
MVYLGLDFGTSGAREIAINTNKEIIAQVNYTWSEHNSTQEWEHALWYLLSELPRQVRKDLKAIALNGTSATVLLCDEAGLPITHPLLYNDAIAESILPQLKAHAPPEHLVLSPTSSFAKLLWWSQQEIFNQARYFLHQADWLAFLLHGIPGISDYHNALKLGYDVQNLRYRDWLTSLPIASILPRVLAPGQAIAPVQKNEYIPSDCIVCTGTTDSIAAFLASGANQPGEAVTSLGSTLVLKLLSETYVENLASGIYSHRLGKLWLTGGASNTGGAVLKHYFSETELITLSEQINPDTNLNLDYYPLLKPGERFPINDPQLVPKLEPRIEEPHLFLQGLLEGIAAIEQRGYRLLAELGATPLSKVYTAGGGAKNLTWQKIRANRLQVPVVTSPYTEAAYGSALLALRCVSNF